jgi:hypothetical protein
VESGRRYQQADACQHEAQRNGIQELHLRRQGIEPLLERAMKLETKEYLRPKH